MSWILENSYCDVACWTELVDGKDVRGYSSFGYIVDHYRCHFLHTGRVMGLFHRRDLDPRTLRHGLLQLHNKILRRL